MIFVIVRKLMAEDGSVGAAVDRMLAAARPGINWAGRG